MAEGEVRVLAEGGAAYLLRLDKITAPDPDTAEARAMLDGFTESTATDLSNAITAAYTQALVNKLGVDVNQPALNAVHAQLP